jgi:hypothetical protein
MGFGNTKSSGVPLSGGTISGDLTVTGSTSLNSGGAGANTLTGVTTTPTGSRIRQISSAGLDIISSTSMAQSVMSVGTTVGRHLVLGDDAGSEQDFDHAAQTNPTLFIHSATAPDTNNTQWVGFTHDATDAVITTGLGHVNITPASGSYTRLINNVPTVGTMTATTTAALQSTWHRYDWTNAMVTALPTTAGDIAVCTLPAKTVVVNAYVVITGAAVGPATVTVAVGRVSAGYIDYIVASDAKAAANTIYGNASAERGTNLVGYDFASMTATMPILAHFISTGANLSTVTGSTGSVYLETVVLP